MFQKLRDRYMVSKQIAVRIHSCWFPSTLSLINALRFSLWGTKQKITTPNPFPMIGWEQRDEGGGYLHRTPR